MAIDSPFQPDGGGNGPRLQGPLVAVGYERRSTQEYQPQSIQTQQKLVEEYAAK